MNGEIGGGQDDGADRIRTGVIAFLAAAVGLTLLLLSLGILPDYANRGLFQAVFLLITIGLLIEGAVRQKKLALPTEEIVYVTAAFLTAIALSFFTSGIDKYEISSETLSRALWPGVVWISFLIASNTGPPGKIFSWVAAGAVAALGWTFAKRHGEEIWILSAAAAGAAVFFFLSRVFAARLTTLRPLSRILLFVIVCGAVWGASTRARLAVTEIELVRNGRQNEKAVTQVAKKCIEENTLFGTGPGSIYRAFLQYRPVDATLQGVPDRLDFAPPSLTVVAAESGMAGFLAFLLFLGLPFFQPSRGRAGAPAVGTGGAAVWAVYGFFLTHELLGGGWMLTPAGSMAFCCLSGILLGKNEGEAEPREVPGGVFVGGLIAAGGILLLQQIFFWRTHEVEKNLKLMDKATAAGKIDEAIELGNHGLFLDSRRNDLISRMIGAMHQFGHIPRALENSLILIERDPLYPAVKNNIMTFYMIMGQPAPAVPYAEAVAQEHPTVDNFGKLGHVQFLAGKKTESLASFLLALDMFPRETDLLMARLPRIPPDEAVAEGQALLDIATFCANAAVRQAGTGPANVRAAIDKYIATRDRLKGALEPLKKEKRG